MCYNPSQHCGGFFMSYVKWPCKLLEETPGEFGLIADELLPDYVRRDGFGYSRQSGIIRSEMEAGYPKTRRRFTATIRNYRVSFTLTSLQFTTFEDFVYNTQTATDPPGIIGGVMPFTFPDPIWKPQEGQSENDRPTMVVRMVAPTGSDLYSVAPDQTNDDWIVAFQLERLPGL